MVRCIPLDLPSSSVRPLRPAPAYAADVACFLRPPTVRPLHALNQRVILSRWPSSPLAGFKEFTVTPYMDKKVTLRFDEWRPLRSRSRCRIHPSRRSGGKTNRERRRPSWNSAILCTKNNSLFPLRGENLKFKWALPLSCCF